MSETYGITDYIVYDDATSDKSSKFGQPTTILSNNDATLVYDSTNQHYVLTKKNTNGLVCFPLTDLTGFSDIVIEYDVYLPYINGAVNPGLAIGNVGFYQLGGVNDQSTINIYDITDHLYGSGHYDNEWIHNKFIISNGTVTWTAKRQNDTEIINRTHNVSISSNTQIGLSIGYGINSASYFKNIKIKAL